MTNPTEFVPTRAAALARMQAFAPRAGRDYARLRNFDFGPGRHHHVSALSPYLRHRLIAEEDVLREVLRLHSPSAAEKFIQEVFWRGYFKGWLEHNPAVWDRYQTEVRHGFAQMETDPSLRQSYQDACAGQTGIDAFDHWMTELTATGWLHNHARMWFASIWIFTLRLPWALGADVFYRHLIDGDPASNTLSWRWVGGLHTKGKTYLARADNIAQFTEGRFAPKGLASHAAPLEEADLPLPRPLIHPAPRFHAGRFGLLLTEDDCGAVTLPLPGTPNAVAWLAPAPRSPLETAPNAAAFTHAALSNMAKETGGGDPVRKIATAGDLIAWATDAGLNSIVLSAPPVGPSRDQITALADAAQAAGIALVPVIRPYDALVWPHARKGFFALKEKIPKLLDALDLSDQPRLI